MVLLIPPLMAPSLRVSRMVTPMVPLIMSAVLAPQALGMQDS